MKHDTGLEQLARPASPTYQGVELRYLRYLVAVADADTFTRAAERMFITQPTLSRQIRRLEEMVGTPMLRRRHDGVQLTEAGSVLVEQARTVLSLVEHGVTRSRQAAGLERPRLRVALQPGMPDRLAVSAASRLQCTADAAGADIAWFEAPLDAEFTLIRQGHAEAGLGWWPASSRERAPDPIDVMPLGVFEPELWIQAAGVFGHGQLIGLAELTDMDVIHGPRRASPGTYDAWQAALRAHRPRFEFTGPRFRHSLPMTLAFAAAAHRPTAVLTGPLQLVGDRVADGERQRPPNTSEMMRASLRDCPLTATAVVAWSCNLPRHLQQVLFDAADAGIPPVRPASS